jgi:putative RecB family exonuclease
MANGPNDAQPMNARSRVRFNRPHWSYSQLSQFMRCPLQYYFERVAGLPRPFAGGGMVLGSAIHEGLANYHRRLQRKEGIRGDDIKGAFLQAWEVSEAERTIQFRDDESRDELLAQGVTLLEAYLAEPPPENILAVEQPLIVPLHNSADEYLEKPLVAVLDLLTREECSGLTVTEFKTSGRRYNEFEADTTLQATCYVHAVQERFGEPAAVRYTVLVKTKKPTVQRLETVRSDADLGRLGDIVQGVERAIEAMGFYPIESPMNCSGCPYRLQCRDWQGTSRHELQQIQAVNADNKVAAC